ncbi:MAG TPA: hypothetical protein VNT26_17610, partial [Candidatus Sulfotelmatobacter sp.]|nr:hypothetical protein [Candidatus Sulfotelmatobacter sp.]
MNSTANLFGQKPGLFSASALVLALAAATANAADLSWSGGTASYNNPANWGGAVPGTNDIAINDNGTNNTVQLNVGDPDWALSQLRAGNSTGNGAFLQNGQTLSLSGSPRALRLGVASGRQGVYTLNGGTIAYGSGEVNVGQLGQGILNINGGSITGGGSFAVNVGSSLDAVTATMDGGWSLDGYTWFEQGFYTPDTTRGLPAAGSTIVSESQPDHSFTLAPSYAANNAVMVNATVTNAIVSFTSPKACAALSFLGSASYGAATLNYTVHHADNTTETGSFVVPDWFDNAAVAYRVGGRVRPTGFDFQIINDGPNKPYLFAADITLANTASPVKSIDLAYASGGRACLLGVSGSSGSEFAPLAVTGYNADPVLEANAPIYVASTVTDTLNQTAGTIDITGELWVGNYGAGIYNLSGGTNTFRNWLALGRSGGNGTLNLTGGELNKVGNGDLLVGSGYQAMQGATPAGVLNHSAGVINDQNGFLCPESAPASGTYNLSGTAVLNVNGWFVIGRNGGSGSFTMTGGSI